MIDEDFLRAVVDEVARARRLFPESDALNCALIEEVGEVSKALMYEPWDAVTKEAVQVAAMALRLIVEGDPSMEDFRWKNVHACGKRYMNSNHIMPTKTR